MGRLWLWWMALAIWVTTSIWVHLFYIKRIRLSEEPVLPPIRITDGAQLRVQLPGSLFQQTKSALRPLGERSALDTLAAYLVANPRRLITVTGYYTSAESQSSLIANLGTVRARTVEQYLINAGVPEDQVQIMGTMAESLPFVRDSTNALSFAFEPVIINADWLARHQTYIDLFHPLQLYFPTGSTEYIHTPDNERFASEAIVYLRTHRQDRLVITGHTDSVGTQARNLRLSQQRAMAVRDQLMRQGADKRGFQILAMGDKMPIAPNALPEGREANRRVTLVVKQR